MRGDGGTGVLRGYSGCGGAYRRASCSVGPIWAQRAAAVARRGSRRAAMRPWKWVIPGVRALLWRSGVGPARVSAQLRPAFRGMWQGEVVVVGGEMDGTVMLGRCCILPEVSRRCCGVYRGEVVVVVGGRRLTSLWALHPPVQCGDEEEGPATRRLAWS